MFERDPKTAQMGKEILPFEMGYLPEFFQRKAEAELNDTPENRQKGLKIIREFMENDKHFYGQHLDDDFLLQYLRCRKFNAKRAYTHLKVAVNLRINYKNLFEDLRFENIAITTRNKIVTFLPYRCQDGCAILFIKLDNWNPEEFPVEQVKRMVIVSVLQSLRDPMTQVNGIKVIFDVETSNPLRQIKHATPSNMYLMYHGTQVHFHATPAGLLDYFPAAVLPVEYGGELKDYDMTGWLRNVMSEEKIATLCGGYSLS